MSLAKCQTLMPFGAKNSSSKMRPGCIIKNLLLCRVDIEMPPLVRHALYSRLPPSFDTGGATLFCRRGNFDAPHRTGLADFPHPALQLPSLHRRQGVEVTIDPRLGNRVISKVLGKTLARIAPPLAPSVNPLVHERQHPQVVTLDPLEVAANPVVP